MEIERKFLIKDMPEDLSIYRYHIIEQAYLNTSPVVRIRREDDNYYMTYKSKGLMVREEYNLPLDEASYRHMLPKADGIVISKKRYLIPLTDELTIELDVFAGDYEGVILAEVEFPTEEDALAFTPPAWFGVDVTSDGRYHNSHMSSVLDTTIIP